MEQELKRKTMVIGHRNPDTDSICSAICYANLKRAITGCVHSGQGRPCERRDQVCTGLLRQWRSLSWWRT